MKRITAVSASTGRVASSVELGLGLVEAPVDLFEHRDEEAFLAAEVVVDHPVVRLRGLRDLLDAAAVVAVLGEHLGRRAQDALARGLRRRSRTPGGRPAIGLRDGRRGAWARASRRSLLGEGALDHEVAGRRRVAFLEAARLEHVLQVASMPGLPQIITRSSAGSSGGRPRSSASLPVSISSVMRPMLRNSSRVTVG